MAGMTCYISSIYGAIRQAVWAEMDGFALLRPPPFQMHMPMHKHLHPHIQADTLHARHTLDMTCSLLTCVDGKDFPCCHAHMDARIFDGSLMNVVVG
jgi:hypothetical protein